MSESHQTAHALLDTPPPQARAFDAAVWTALEHTQAVDALVGLVERLAELHQAGFELCGVERQDLMLDAGQARLYLVRAPRMRLAAPEASADARRESIWRDARLIGELAYEQFMAEPAPDGHQLAALLQEREAMAQIGLLQPGLTQVVAACVSPFGELALDDMRELKQALGLLRREIVRPVDFRVGLSSTMGNYIFRRNNQDSCGYQVMRTIVGSAQHSVGFFCVADGIGGIRDGAEASRLAVQTACAAFGRALNHYGAERLAQTPGDFARAIVQVCSQQLALFGEFDPAHNRGGSTFTCLLIAAGRAGLGHVGDSRAVLVRRGELLAMSHDHTLENILKDLGEPPADKAAAEMSRRTISRFLTTGMELEAERIDGFGAPFLEFIAREDPESAAEDPNHTGFPVRPGDLFLLTSDGVHDELTPERMRQLIAMHRHTPQDLTNALLQQALAQVGRDNATALAVLIE